MKTEPKVGRTHSITTLIDDILNFKMNSQEYASNEKIVLKIGETIDSLNKYENGYTLLSITKDKESYILLITKTGTRFSTYKWRKSDSLDKAVSIDVYELVSGNEIEEFLSNISYYNRDYISSAMIVETMSGYKINLSVAKEFHKYMEAKEKSISYAREDAIRTFDTPKLIELGTKILKYIKDTKDNTKKTVDQFRDKYKDIPIKLEHSFGEIQSDKVLLGSITNVQEIGGQRHYNVNWLSFEEKNSRFKTGWVRESVNWGVRSDSMEATSNGDSFVFRNNNYDEDDNYAANNLSRIPYNLADKGRYLIGIKTDPSQWRLFISPDPKIMSDYVERFESNIKEYLSNHIDSKHSLSESNIELKETIGDKQIVSKMIYDNYESVIRRNSPDVQGTQLKLKALKTMFDEYNYLVKKNKSIGSDVTVTDNIKYNHNEGKISYNDFSIAIDDDFIKSRLYELFSQYLMDFYRGESTEQDILDKLTTGFFNILTERLYTGRKEDLKLIVKINGIIDINITGKLTIRKSKEEIDGVHHDVSSGQLFYLNDQRFNKNEIITVLKEITCYRDQKEANAFIKNIGRLGLSVYIGITTGYELSFPGGEQRIFRFKKLKGRSNYQLLLNDTSIDIKGKKIISIIYSNFIGDHVPDLWNKIPQIIYEGSGSTVQYLKYKALIDTTYVSYKEKAKAFLDKKVADMGANAVAYYNRKARKIMDAIYIEGLSKKKYIIAYDAKDSYVFMDPSEETESVCNHSRKTYCDGKYICMIDQSNIKSNIGYDTVVAKLMALKNDSSIAHTIYNLQEEL